MNRVVIILISNPHPVLRGLGMGAIPIDRPHCASDYNMLDDWDYKLPDQGFTREDRRDQRAIQQRHATKHAYKARKWRTH